MEKCTKKRSRVIAVSLVLFLIAAMLLGTVVTPVRAASTSNVTIGQATSNEKRKSRGGKAGDQTGKEVSFDSWSYSKKSGNYNNWQYVFRAKNPKIAKKLAQYMKDTCNNDKIGYDQKWPDRVSFYDQAKAVNWDIKNITKKCETTCTQSIAVCINAVGIELPRYWDASMVYDDLKATGKFKIYKNSKHCANDSFLEPGDILLSPGVHAAMVVDSPNACGAEAKAALKKAAAEVAEAAKKAVEIATTAKTTAKTTASTTKTTTTKKRIKYKVGKNYTLKKVLNVRTGPGKKYPNVMKKNLTADGKKHATKSKYGRLKKGTVVTCLKVKGNWMKIPSGWICCKPGNLK